MKIQYKQGDLLQCTEKVVEEVCTDVQVVIVYKEKYK
jgi:hypothetical protein